MITLLKDITSLVRISSDGSLVKKGYEMRNVEEVADGAILFDEKIKWVGKTSEANQKLEEGEFNPDRVFSLKGRTLFPGFVDSHTHLVFAGDRASEFARKVSGATYQEIASEGGGILTTVKATRQASFEELYEISYLNVERAISYGTIALEIKSGYGLELETEIKMLKVIEKLQKDFPIYIVPTFLGAHDFPPEYKNRRDEYVNLLCLRMIPKVAELGLAKYCDCFVDESYYTIDQAQKIFETAQRYGMRIKIHADELADVGAGGFAGDIGSVSADHLLYVSDESLEKMSKGNTIATLLPGTSYFSRLPYAPAKKIISKGLAVAIASDFNPGSCFTENMQIILSLSVTNLGLNCEESLVASTLNGASAIELSDRIGSIEVGKDATFVVANCKNYLELFYHFGINHIESCWVKGKKFLFNI
ncbi:MAG: imidazolonepropionase [Candidatus Kapaibacteriales bacterium]